MSQDNAYLGGYALVEAETEEQSKMLGSSLCSVGTRVYISYDTSDEKFQVLTPSQQVLGVFSPKQPEKLRQILEESLSARAWISLVFYGPSKRFQAEIAYITANVPVSGDEKNTRDIEAFSAGVQEMIIKGERPKVSLSPAQASKMFSLNGIYLPESGQMLPIDTSPKSGYVVYKAKQSNSDKLVHKLVNRNPKDHNHRFDYKVMIMIAIVLVAVGVLWADFA